MLSLTLLAFNVCKLVVLQGNATLHLYPHFEPLRQIESEYIIESFEVLLTSTF